MTWESPAQTVVAVVAEGDEPREFWLEVEQVSVEFSSILSSQAHFTIDFFPRDIGL